MEHNLSRRQKISTRAQSALGGGEGQTFSLANPPKKTSKMPHQTEESGNIDEYARVTTSNGHRQAKVPIDHHRPDNDSSHNNYAPRKQEGRTTYLSDVDELISLFKDITLVEDQLNAMMPRGSGCPNSELSADSKIRKITLSPLILNYLFGPETMRCMRGPSPAACQGRGSSSFTNCTRFHRLLAKCCGPIYGQVWGINSSR
ncbi:hypothetical protein LIER_27281 [Lithospermum erythrorhizon]|uniref:Uncharacterized protein n=1 Tax=Lithospermum erythrorhizon TaxID=34254 RepID=A0AAV3RBF9_LITER